MVLGEQRFLKSCIFESFLKEGRGLPQSWQSLGGGCTTGGTGYEISLDSCACTDTLPDDAHVQNAADDGQRGTRSSWESDGRVT